jgi:hypothetical protein
VYRRIAALFGLALLALLIAVDACHDEASRHYGTFSGTIGTPPAFSYQSGTTGTVTVPADTFVTSLWAVGGSGGGTVTITPAYQNYPTCVQADAGWIVIDAGDGDVIDGGPADGGPCTATGSTITIPSGAVLQIGRPILNGAANELADGTILTFTGTSGFVVTQLKYGP